MGWVASRTRSVVEVSRCVRDFHEFVLFSLVIFVQGSTNGVFLNEVKILEQPLEHGDVVQFGGAADIPVGTRFGGSGNHIRCAVVTHPCLCLPAVRASSQLLLQNLACHFFFFPRGGHAMHS